MSASSSLSQQSPPVTSVMWPIVYHKDYNISFIGMEKLHPFDSGKWGRVHRFLIGEN